MHVTVINPDDPFGTPAYDGPSNLAHTILAPGNYTATLVSDDEHDGTEVGLLVMEDWSVAGAVVAIDLVHEQHGTRLAAPLSV